jgi:hypothetical protein
MALDDRRIGLRQAVDEGLLVERERARPNEGLPPVAAVNRDSRRWRPSGTGRHRVCGRWLLSVSRCSSAGRECSVSVHSIGMTPVPSPYDVANRAPHRALPHD